MSETSRLRSRLLYGVAAATVVLIAPLAAQAQTTTKTDGTTAQSASGIAEVVVTAEKRSVNLQSVPLAVTAFTSKERALEGINSVQDLTNFTPGLVYSSQLDRPAVRGLARTTNQYSADSSIGVYDNDLFTNSTFLVGRDDMIVDQVEVLLGPQNTLYGRGAIGGIINTQSKRPSDVFGGEIRDDFGNYGYNKPEATITGPVPFIPHLTFRFSGYYDSQDQGYFKNLTGKDVGGVHHDPYEELQLEYKTEKDDIWLEAYNLNFFGDRGGPGGSIGAPTLGPYDTALFDVEQTLTPNPNAAYGASAIPGTVVSKGPTSNPSTKTNRTVASYVNEVINVDDAYDVNFHWTHHFDGFDVKYVGGYSQYHYQLTGPNAFNGTNSSVQSFQTPVAPLSVVPAAAGNICGAINAEGGTCAPATIGGGDYLYFNTHTDWTSHEVDFTSTTQGKVSWIGGLYFFSERDNNPNGWGVNNQPQLLSQTWNVIPVSGAAGYIPTLATGGTPALAPIASYNGAPNGCTLCLDYQDFIDTAAVFGQASYKITETLKFTAGVRYSADHKDAQEEARYIDFDSVLPASILGQFTPGVDLTPLLASQSPGIGVASPVTFPQTGKYAGYAVRKLSHDTSAFTGTAALEWTPDKDTLAYARYNRGYKPFAFNAGFIDPDPTTKNEYVNDYELGLKESVGRHVQVNIDAFYYDYSNDQVPLTIPSITGAGVLNQTVIINIPKAVSDGVEITGVWEPVSHLVLSLTYGLDHTEVTSGCAPFSTPVLTAPSGCFINAQDPLAIGPGAKPAGPSVNGDEYQSIKGAPLLQAPENKIALNANYTLFFDPGNLTLSGSYIWRDDSFATPFPTRTYGYAPSWSQVDLRATWSGDHDRYEVVAYVKNLFNTIGYDAAYPGYGNAMEQGTGAYGFNEILDETPPRLYGAEIHYKF